MGKAMPKRRAGKKWNLGMPRLQTVLTVGLAAKVAGLALAVFLSWPALVSGPTPVRAQEKKAPAQKEAQKEKPKKAKASTQKDPGKTTEDKAPPVAEAQIDPRLFRLLEDKRKELKQQEEQIEQQRRDIQKLKARVSKKIKELQQLQGMVESLAQQEKKQRRKRVLQLVKVLSNMRPPAAAAVVSKLDEQMAVEIFIYMQSRQAGKVMGNLDPEKAARIGELLTRRKKAQAAARAASEATAKIPPVPNLPSADKKKK
jgi:flagellar motility protein MotE (MotC chaperone)